MSTTERRRRPDICLVNTPHFYLQCPSLALGLLKALAQQTGFSARVVYANLNYADIMAPQTLDLMRTGSKFLGEWFFGRGVFPGRDPHAWRRLGMDDRLPARVDSAAQDRAVADAQDEADRFIDVQARDILKDSPRIVGCTTAGCQHLPALALLRRVRELRPDVITLLGGPNCEEDRGVATHRLFPWIDFVVSGDADDLFGPLLSVLVSGQREIPPDALPFGVFGPVHRQIGYPKGPDGAAPRAVARSMVESPVPDYAEYFETLSASTRLRHTVNPHIPVETSRGCWWAVKQQRPCSFCGVNGMRESYAVKPPARTLQELDTLHERHGVTRFSFNDNMMSKSYFRTLLPELARRGRPYRIFGQMTARLEEEEVRMLGEAGFEMVQPGLESLHTKALDAMRKPTGAWQNVQTMKWCVQYGVATTWALLSDIPGESDEWYQEMAALVPLITHLSPPRRVGRIYVSRNSEYQRRAAEYGLDLAPDEDASILYPVAPNELKHMALIFQDVEREQRFNDPMSFLFRPGLVALRREVDRWRTAYLSASRPHLTMEDDGRTLRIFDTRPIAVEPAIDLAGLEREVYIECWAAVTEAELVERFERRGATAAAVRAAADSLVARKILVAIDGRFLALATRYPMRTVSDEPWFEPTAAEWPAETAPQAAPCATA